MAEGDSIVEQPTSEASTADISQPDMNTNATYNNHNDDNKASKKHSNSKSNTGTGKRGSRTSLSTIQVILLDDEEFNCQIDVTIIQMQIINP